MSNKNEARIRFAPSPTGHLHIGSVRVAIFNWLFAKHNNGKFLVRIEDTDVKRSTKEYTESILDSLKWMNMQPDESIVYQSKRFKEYKKIAYELIENELAYPCFCSHFVKTTRNKPEKNDVGQKYPGICRNKKFTKEDLEKPHAIRFKLPEDLKTISFHDEIRGDISVDIDQLDDFIIIKQDKSPAYNFCVVVDDIFMNITHLIRGEDHISNTPKQILIYKALKSNVPVFAHLPLILGQSGNKLSKRDAATSVIEYKDQGYLPDALFNYLVRLGWAHGDQEIFTKKELIDLFSLDKVGKKGAIFDTKKLQWVNGVYIRNLNFDDFLTHVSDVNIDKKKELTDRLEVDKLATLFELYKERSFTICKLADSIIEFASPPKKLDLSLIQKWVSDKTKNLLEEFLIEIKQMEGYNHEILLSLSKNICQKYNSKLVEIAQPLRLALTGKTFSPGVFELIAVLSVDEVTKRINNLISKL